MIAGAAVVALTAGSVSALAATHSGNPHGSRVANNGSTCTEPELSGGRVTVMLSDMAGSSMRSGGMMGTLHLGPMAARAVPSEVPAGQVSIVAFNHGTRSHELVVLPLAPGATIGSRSVGTDNKVSEADSLGEASNNCGAGAGEGINPGAASWVTLTLKPGRYELVCNLAGHYAAGMYTELDVA